MGLSEDGRDVGMQHELRDHGGGLDAAAARFGGARAEWLDLSTGINPVPYTLPDLPKGVWTELPDRNAAEALEHAARSFWDVPSGAAVLAVPGASSAIARLPALAAPGRVHVPGPTYNEHAAAFAAHGWEVEGDADAPGPFAVRVIVNPDNPTGRWWGAEALGAPLTVIDESFSDLAPDRSLIAHAGKPGHVVLKSFGKFWGLPGLRLGFVIGPSDAVERLAALMGPWPVSGPALVVGRAALRDTGWARAARIRLNEDAAHLDALMLRAGAVVAGGTALFRLYRVGAATGWQEMLAKCRIWSRVFPWSSRLIRLGLPGPDDWGRLEAALAAAAGPR